MENTLNFLQDDLRDRTAIFKPCEGELIDMMGGRITLKITSNISNDQLGLYQITLAPHTIGARLHFHRFMDETFIVNSGTLSIQTSKDVSQLGAGAVAYVPRYTPHGFSNETDEEVSLMLLFNPAENREGFFYGLQQVMSESPVDPKKMLTLYNKYDSYPVDVTNMIPAKI